MASRHGVTYPPGLTCYPSARSVQEAHRARKAGTYPTSFAPPSWSNTDFRRLVSFLILSTAANVVIGGQLTYSAMEYMDSVSFCGQACHIMTPEFTAYAVSSHSEVSCVECHIGSGARSFVVAKLDGARQMIAVIAGTYPTPVPTPVHNLAQGSLTCGRCHADRDFGVKRWQRFHFGSDEGNSAKRTQLTLVIGGGDNPKGAHGAHFSGGATLEYRAEPDRETIHWMRYVAPDGEETVYARASWDEQRAQDYELRKMDCVDCHNRAAHSFEDPQRAVDRSLSEGRIDPSLPFVRQQGLELIRAGYDTPELAEDQIAEALRAFYQADYPELAAGRGDEIVQASSELAAIRNRNVFPEWGVDWGTHPHQSGHEDYPGCFRCHNDQLVSQDAAAVPIGDDCSVCHAVESVGQPVSSQELTQLARFGGVGFADLISFETALGAVPFDHSRHTEYENASCASCHNRFFPMDRSPLGYGADLHAAAEAAQSSCAGCHVAGGTAFATAGNCNLCHTNLSPEQTVTQAVPSLQPRPPPGDVEYTTSLGTAVFNHALHADREGATCADCHNVLFPMASADLNYGEDFHRAAEATQASCAGCHFPGGAAFAAADNCALCHKGLGEPRVTPSTGVSGIPELPNLDTRIGPARFDHERHVELAEGSCQTCHNEVFPLTRGLLNYADNLHRTAEANQTSCGSCHRPTGTAFAAEDNCLQCHVDPTAQAAGSAMGLRASLVYGNRLGDVEFDHDQHILDANNRCVSCHNASFPMNQVGLAGYAEDYHRSAETNGASCASCHHPDGSAFGSLNNCTRCHIGLELPDQASIAWAPWALLLFFAVPGGLLGQGRGFIGSERCVVCHKETAQSFSTNPHAPPTVSGSARSAPTTCESCHGPALAHVQALSADELAVFAEGQPSIVNQSCLTCHARDIGQSTHAFSPHLAVEPQEVVHGNQESGERGKVVEAGVGAMPVVMVEPG